MKSMQDKILQYVEDVAVSNNRPVNVNKGWENTGYLFVFLEDGTIKKAYYSFQNTYATFDFPNAKRMYTYTKDWDAMLKDLSCFVRKGKSFYTAQ